MVVYRSILDPFGPFKGLERHLVIGKLYIHTFSDSLDHGGHIFDSLAFKIQISISRELHVYLIDIIYPWLLIP